MAAVAEVESLFARCSRMMLTITRLPQPVIAKVHGLATAAGCQLVATCDLAVASESATFATPGVNIGAFCSTPGVALGRAVGRKHAMEMLLTGAPITAARACEIGLVNRVVPAEALDAEVSAMARLIATQVFQRDRVGQRGLLPSARTAAGRGVRRRRTRHCLRLLHRGRQGRGGRLPRKARAPVAGAKVGSRANLIARAAPAIPSRYESHAAPDRGWDEAGRCGGHPGRRRTASPSGRSRSGLRAVWLTSQMSGFHSRTTVPARSARHRRDRRRTTRGRPAARRAARPQLPKW